MRARLIARLGIALPGLALLALGACSPAPASKTPAEESQAAAPVADEPPSPLLDTSWVMADQTGSPPTIVFAQDTASGATGCHAWSAEWASSGPAMNFSAPAASGAARSCSPAQREAETAFLRTLQNTQGFAIEGQVLTLRDMGGVSLARFNRQT